tara:strand:+ start:7748 stop:8236 length:489 start_codon:yes stop_codon:yes gene_type:complete
MSEFNIDQSKMLTELAEYSIENEPLEPFKLMEIQSDHESQDSELNQDYELSRTNLNKVEQMGFEMLKNALENARNSDAPRQVEVFQQLLKQMSDLQSDRLDIHSKYKKIKNDNGSTNKSGENSTTINGETVVFTGTPAQLMSQRGSNTDVKRQEKEVNPKED